MLCTAFNAVGFNWLASPAVTELEMVVMDWFAQMLKLPKSFMFSDTGGGVIQGTTSEAILCTLIAARDRALECIGVDNIGKLVVYGSDQTHSTYTKACKLAGIVPSNIRSVPTKIDNFFTLSPELLKKTIEADVADGLVPLYVCATVGTTSTTAVDPVEAIASVAKDYGIWVHVDAAYGGSACICPEFRHYLNGVEQIDSLSLSPHKWLLSYLDCCCLWVKNPGLLVKALSTNPEYLKNKASESQSVVDYKDWQVGTGRRFKALRLWLIFRSYGVANLQSHIRSDVRMAKMFEGFIKLDPRFEIVVPRRFSLVCFRLNPGWSDLQKVERLNRKLLEWLNSTGRVYMTHTIVGGVYMLRFAVGATLTEERHVIAAWKLIREGTDLLLKEENVFCCER
ncbi:Pyridoxal phosphate-dependent decarboxylase [Dillenia turbinata]|uniref:Pyridoxal phosphate-dependent decarboxylase n=1 Tax=Dillenia turbinata TaxID=194707 RepID=A0AAN8YY59_9MAGN